jgi:F-type H+-transporting ATPase subunit alpha
MSPYTGVLDDTLAALDLASRESATELRIEEYGVVAWVSRGVARVTGLPGVKSEELVEFAGGLSGMAFNLDPDEVGVVLLDDCTGIEAGSEVRRTHRVLDTPVGDALLGRVVDPLGRPLDDAGPIKAHERAPIECDAPSIMDRLPVTEPLATGTKVVDALIPVGFGQRELILGDRQTGKTAIAVDCILNQKDRDVICIYCAVGRRNSSVASVIPRPRQPRRTALFHRRGSGRRLAARPAANFSCARAAMPWWCSTI